MDHLQALRARGAERCDPVRWRFIEALAQRTQAHAGAARALLDARLQALLQAYAQEHAAALDQGTAGASTTASTATTAAAATPGPAAPGPLQTLGAHIAAVAAPPGSDLQTLAWFRRTWSRLAAGRRMKQSLAKKPEKAGPINSHGLVLRALQQMGAVSPDYLDRYVAYVDALLSLDQATGGSAMQHRDVLRVPGSADAANAAPKRQRNSSRATAKAAEKTADKPAVAAVRSPRKR